MEIVTSIYGNCDHAYAEFAVISRKFLEYENTHENFESLCAFLGPVHADSDPTERPEQGRIAR